MKKKLVAFCMLVALVFSAMGGIAAFAEVSLEECDLCFQTTVNGFLDDDAVEGNKINAVRKPVYDIDLQHLGYVYEFKIIGGEGYAIVICDDGNYIAQEFVPSSQSPYASLGENELCVYVNSMTYLKHNGAAYLDIATSAEIEPDVLQTLYLNAILYKQSEYETQEKVNVTIKYTSRKPNYKNLNKNTPSYLNPGDLRNACAAIAGANILGFYDRYYDNLIPNFTAGKEMYGYYLYGAPNSYLYDAMRELYSDMNGSEAGITESNFKSGMQKFCNKKNLSCDFTSLMSGGKLNYNSVINSIEENKPVALLLSTYTVCDILGYNGYDDHLYNMYYGDHIMAGFGYLELTYNLTSGGTENYKFVYVASGFIERSEGYFNINYSTNINSAYKVYIH